MRTLVVSLVATLFLFFISTSENCPRRAHAYSVQCLPASPASPVQCTGSIAGYCLNSASGMSTSSSNCCDPSHSVGALMCASYVDSRGNVSYASSARCAADGEQAKCPSANSEYITGLCVGGASSTCSGDYACVNSLDVISVRCASSPGVEIVSATCHWQYASTNNNGAVNPDAASCIEQREVAAGICYSPVNRWCAGHAFGVYCCGISNELSRSNTKSASKSRKTPSASFSLTTNVTLSATVPDTLTHAPTHTVTVPPTATLTRSYTYVPPRTPTPTRSLSGASSSLIPTVTISPPPTHSPSTSATPGTLTQTLPSMTVPRVPTRTLSLIPPYALSLALVSSSSSSAEARSSSTIDASRLSGESQREVLTLSVSHQAVWRGEKALPFVVQHVTGTQPRNPFGFDARKEGLVSRVDLVSAEALQLTLRGDRCFEPRGDEIITFNAPSNFFVPETDVAHAQLVVVETSTTVQEWVGVGLFSLCCLLLLAAAAKADSGALALHAVLALQSLLLILEHACTRRVMHAYSKHMIVLVMPTYFFFPDDIVYSAVTLTHLGTALLALVVALFVCRVVPSARLYFPNVPFCVAALLAPGMCYAGWKAILGGHSHVALRVITFILATVFLLAFVAFLVAKRSPKGLKLARFSAGTQRLVFRGVWFPHKLHSKYSLLVHCWKEGNSSMTLLLLAHDLVVAFLCAHAVSNTDDCFAIFCVLFLFSTLLILVLIRANPARGAAMLALILAPLFANLCVLSGVMVGLDCRGNYPSNTRYGEAILVIALVIHVAADAGILVVGLMERRAIVKLATELREQHVAQQITSATTTTTSAAGTKHNKQHRADSSSLPSLEAATAAGDGFAGDDYEEPDNLTSALAAYDRSASRARSTSFGGGKKKAMTGGEAKSYAYAGSEGDDDGSPTLPPLTRFELRDEVADDPVDALPRGAAAAAARRDASNSYRSLETVVPGVSNASPSPSHRAFSSAPQLPQREGSSVAPLRLNLPFAASGLGSSETALALPASSVSPEQDLAGAAAATERGLGEWERDEEARRRKMAKRRALLGQADPSKCCVRCRRYVGASTLCDECAEIL